MKSLLVDALRAANDTDDGLSLEETVAPGLPAVRPGTEAAIPEAGAELSEAETASPETEVVAPSIDPDLELLDSVEESLEVDVADNDAEFRDEQAVPEASLHEQRVAPAAARAAMFERAAKWMPAVCLLLAACSAAAFSGWSNITGASGNEILGTHSGSTNEMPESETTAADAPAARFQFSDAARTPTQGTRREVAAPDINTATQVGPISIVRNNQARAPRDVAGLTDVDNANFSSIAAVYQAFVGGQINQSALDRLLDRAAMTGGEGTELEIKLLLQRYPDSASLHNALGTVLANSSRWPEARVAYDRAIELAQNTPRSAQQ